MLGGVLPTPAVALLALDLGVVISASHNPPEYNGVKFFDARGRKLSDAAEEEIEALLDAPPAVEPGEIERVDGRGRRLPRARARALRRRPGRAADRRRLRERRVLGARAATRSSGSAPRSHAIGNEPDGSNINVGCGATDIALLQRDVVDGGFDLGIAFDGDGDRMLAVDEHGEVVDGDQIVAILALDLGVDLVAVTVMTNLGFHALMARARHPRRHDRRRRPLRARGARSARAASSAASSRAT